MFNIFYFSFQIKNRVQTLLNQQGGSVKDIRSVLRGNTNPMQRHYSPSWFTSNEKRFYTSRETFARKRVTVKQPLYAYLNKICIAGYVWYKGILEVISNTSGRPLSLSKASDRLASLRLFFTDNFSVVIFLPEYAASFGDEKGKDREELEKRRILSLVDRF